jgi:hypothetical protein
MNDCLEIGHPMAYAVSCQPLTTETHVRSQASPYNICDGQSGTGTDFSRILYICPVIMISPVLCTPFHLHVALTRRTNG